MSYHSIANRSKTGTIRAPSGPGAQSVESTSESEDRFQKIFRFSHDAILIIDSTADRFLDVNPRALSMFGYSHEDFREISPTRVLSSLAATWDLFFTSVLNTGKRSVKGIQCRRKSGRLIPCDIIACTAGVAGKSCILATVHDISHYKHAALRNHAAFVRFLNAVAVGAAYQPSIEHVIRFYLQHICDHQDWVFGHARMFAERIVSASVPTDIWHLGLHAPSGSLRRVIDLGQLVARSEWHGRIVAAARALVIEDLEKEPYFAGESANRDLGLRSAIITPILVGKEVVGVCEFFSHQAIMAGALLLPIMTNMGARLGDVIERRRAEDAVQRLSTRLFQVQDDERRRLACELHDTTAQNVSAIIMDLNVIDQNMETSNPMARDVLSECITLAHQSLREIRTCSYLLHPPMIDELGFVSALRIFIENFSRRSAMKINLDIPNSYTRLPSELETTLFRVVQEGLTNARRYSRSPTVDIRIILDATSITLTIENESTPSMPFSARSVSPAGGGVGTCGIRERVNHFGGKVTLRADLNRTVLQVTLPLAFATKAATA